MFCYTFFEINKFFAATKTNKILMKIKFFIVLCFSTILSVTSQEISDTSFGKGLINFTAKDSSFSIKFAPRFQMRYMGSWDHDGDQYGSPEHNILIRRARLKFDGFAYSPKLKLSEVNFQQRPDYVDC